MQGRPDEVERRIAGPFQPFRRFPGGGGCDQDIQPVHGIRKSALGGVKDGVCGLQRCLALSQPERHPLPKPLAELVGMVRQFPSQGACAFAVHDDRVSLHQGIVAGRQLPLADSGTGPA